MQLVGSSVTCSSTGWNGWEGSFPSLDSGGDRLSVVPLWPLHTATLDFSHGVYILRGTVCKRAVQEKESGSFCQFSYVAVSKYSEHYFCCILLVKAVTVLTQAQRKGTSQWGSGHVHTEGCRIDGGCLKTSATVWMFLRTFVHHMGVHVWRGLIGKSVALCLLLFHLGANSWRDPEAWALSRGIRFWEKKAIKT